MKAFSHTEDGIDFPGGRAFPRPLTPGSHIALVAPASPFDENKFTRACEGLREEGYFPVPGRHIFRKRKYVAGTPHQRAVDLVEALSDPGIAAVLCLRGGYGSGQTLPWLPLSAFRKSPKIFMGYSDVTFLHSAFHRHVGWPTFHGPNILEAADSRQGLRRVLECLRGDRPFSWSLEERHVLRHGKCSGTVVGGNLTCLAHLTGTPFFPHVTGDLLLLEDRGESLYRLDRLVTHLKLAGVFDRVGGILLGHFQDCGGADGVLEMILEQLRPFSFPVVAGLPFGHGDVNEVIPLGILFHLDTRRGVLEALQSPFHG